MHFHWRYSWFVVVCCRKASPKICYVFFFFFIDRNAIWIFFPDQKYIFLTSRHYYSTQNTYSNQQSKSEPRRGPASISNTPEIPDILIPWDLLSYLLWESEFMMSKLGFFICVPGGLQHAAEMAWLIDYREQYAPFQREGEPPPRNFWELICPAWAFMRNTCLYTHTHTECKHRHTGTQRTKACR